MTSRQPVNPERSFGVSVGAVLGAIAVVLWWRGRPGRAEVVGAIGAALLVLGLTAPALLTWPSAAWWRFSRTLGFINARVLLSILFGLVLTPIGVAWRIARKDPLDRSRGRWTGWSPYPSRYRDVKHYERMY